MRLAGWDMEILFGVNYRFVVKDKYLTVCQNDILTIQKKRGPVLHPRIDRLNFRLTIKQR